jgi:hypothetical protein
MGLAFMSARPITGVITTIGSRALDRELSSSAATLDHSAARTQRAGFGFLLPFVARDLLAFLCWFTYSQHDVP